MGLSYRRFLVARDGTPYRLANTHFDRMLRDPGSHLLPVLAGQRVRVADVVVELDGRLPVRVAMRNFGFMSFDLEGRIDLDLMRRQQWARAEVALGSAFDEPTGQKAVVDASARFVARGGMWRPSKALADAIDEAALGRRKCQRL